MLRASTINRVLRLRIVPVTGSPHTHLRPLQSGMHWPHLATNDDPGEHEIVSNGLATEFLTIDIGSSPTKRGNACFEMPLRFSSAVMVLIP